MLVVKKMLKRKNLAVFALVLCLTTAGAADAQKNAKEAEAPAPADLAEYYSTPNQSHRAIDWLEGSWEGNLTIWGYGSPPPEAHIYATMDNHWLYNGRFLESDLKDFEGSTPAELAKPPFYQSTSFFGYDNKERSYWSLVLGTDYTTYLQAAGSLDAKTERLELLGSQVSAVTGDSFTRIEVFEHKASGEIDYQVRYGFQDGSEITAIKGTFKHHG